MAPLPVPRSRTWAGVAGSNSRAASTSNSVSGRDQSVRCYFQVEFPEALLAEDIGHRLAAAAALQVAGKGQRVFAAADDLSGQVSGSCAICPGQRPAATRVQAPWQSGRSAARAAQQAGDDGHLVTYRRQLVGLVFGEHGSITRIHAPGGNFVEGIQGEVDPMVHGPWAKVVGTDTLGAIRRSPPAAFAGNCVGRGAGLLVVQLGPSNQDMARARFLCWERSSWHSTMPDGKCVIRIAESVLLTCWPPAPDER